MLWVSVGLQNHFSITVHRLRLQYVVLMHLSMLSPRGGTSGRGGDLEKNFEIKFWCQMSPTMGKKIKSNLPHPGDRTYLRMEE